MEEEQQKLITLLPSLYGLLYHDTPPTLINHQTCPDPKLNLANLFFLHNASSLRYVIVVTEISLY